ncbi:hypothetical protein PSPO01_15353 [Paraphaeosphaeria sporulosa]
MAASDSDYHPSTPPPAPAKRTRKRTVKVLETEILQQLPTIRVAAQPAQGGSRATALQLTQNEPGSTQQHRAQDELPPSVSLSLGRAPARGSTGIGELAVLIASLKETITQQNNIIANQNKIIEDIRSDRATFQSEQQHLKDHIAELQETIGSLRAQLDTLSIEPPSTQTWAAVAAGGRPTRPGMASTRPTKTGTTRTEDSRQIVIDVSRVREDVANKVATTEAARQAIQQGMNGVDQLAGATIKDFRVWRANDNVNVIKFLVDKNTEAAFRQTTAEWLDPQIPGARLVGPKWYPVKADLIEVTLAMDAESGKVSKSAMERFGTENGVEVCTMRWLGKPRPSGQHASVVIKVATKEEAEKLLRSDGVTFGGGGLMMSRFEERRTPVLCFNCRRFGHGARDCKRPVTCDMCAQEGHAQCETVNLRCVNCQGPHRSSSQKCPEYEKEKDRIANRQRHE